MDVSPPMVAKVARAICEARALPGTKPAKPAPWFSEPDRRMAIAAIEAMEPEREFICTRCMLRQDPPQTGEVMF